MSFSYYLESDTDADPASVSELLSLVLGPRTSDCQHQLGNLLVGVRKANATDAEGTLESFGFTPALVVSFRHLPGEQSMTATSYDLMLRSVNLLLEHFPKCSFFLQAESLNPILYCDSRSCTLQQDYSD